MPIKAVFLDVDGTLIDSNDYHVASWQEVFRRAGINLDKDVIRAQIGKGGDQLVPSLAPQLSPEEQQALSREREKIFRERYRAQAKPFPMAADLIRRLHTDGKKVILSSSSKREEIDYYTELLDVGDILDGATTADDAEASKPQGDIFAAALALVFPFSPGETIAVGDSPYDVLSAARNTVKTIGLLSGGFSELVLEEAGAVTVYHSVKDLYEHYDRSPLVA
jgi:phosphoglycolate phosphatase-like HAD superfamily hydrolase